jgi:hypothetical protein
MINDFDWTGSEEFIKEVSFPITLDSTATFLDSLKRKLEVYKTFIKSFTARNSKLDWELSISVNSLCDTIIQCINLYYQGSAWVAYTKLIDNLIYIYQYLPISVLPEGVHLYRMRVSPVTLKRIEDIFHIPFSKRYLVESQRYSIAGLPCLYLGSSHFVCWYELNKPNFNSLYTSSFKSLQPLKFIDVSMDLEYIKETLSNSEIKKCLFSYPIVIACNIDTRFSESKFNEEYIIPNILLQWILVDKEINGIKYMSVKYANNNFQDKLLNYVLPPKKITNKEYCEILVKLFSITKPASFSVLMHGPNPEDLIAFQTITGIDPESVLLNSYRTTIFGRTENILMNLPHNSFPD